MYFLIPLHSEFLFWEQNQQFIGTTSKFHNDKVHMINRRLTAHPLLGMSTGGIWQNHVRAWRSLQICLLFTNPGFSLNDVTRLIDLSPRSRNESMAQMMLLIDMCQRRGSAGKRRMKADK